MLKNASKNFPRLGRGGRVGTVTGLTGFPIAVPRLTGWPMAVRLTEFRTEVLGVGGGPRGRMALLGPRVAGGVGGVLVTSGRHLGGGTFLDGKTMFSQVSNAQF